MGGGDPEGKQTKFVDSVFKKYSVKTCIDLGGGVGIHDGPLQSMGYQVTNFDASQNAIDIVKQNFPHLKTILGSFEDINLESHFDAAISMWSTANYVLDPTAREKFYEWMQSHSRRVIIIDQPNFLIYPPTFYRVYTHEGLRIERSWTLSKDHRRETSFTYHMGESTIHNSETQQFLLVDELKKLLGNDWKLISICGDYDLNCPFVETSTRMISVFEKKTKD
ncbi:methyltransferase domain-containing protein [Candidatus Woesearchaeota archaeon]|nr:methyltransferase domain-containing protein [Candidatus Woesearchaeota archaeon]